MNSYQTSTGERLPKGRIDRNVRKAKELKLAQFLDYHGYYFCEDCHTSHGRIDCSHTISVKYAQETRRTELAWDINNIKLRCASCHDILDAKPNFVRHDRH